MNKPLVTILIPNYKTEKLTKLCLYLLREYTDLKKVKIIVIDNHSEDESVEYLRSQEWITLVERTPQADDTPPLSHSRALDMALETVDTPYVLSIHTDTLIKNKEWLDYLLSHIEGKPDVAGVGSWKLEHKPWINRALKKIERVFQRAWYTIIQKKKHALQGVGENYYYLRSHCALYRTALLHKHHITFSDENQCAGKVMHKKLCDLGFKMIFLPSEQLIKYLEHANHATTVLNPQLGSRKKSIKKGEKRLKETVEKFDLQIMD